jgi:hypothetical protein
MKANKDCPFPALLRQIDTKHIDKPAKKKDAVKSKDKKWLDQLLKKDPRIIS